MNLLSYIGVPYKPRGAMPNAADCWTLIRAFAEVELGQHWPEFMYDARHYKRAARDLILEETTGPGGRWQRAETPQLGDVLIFRMNTVPMHCAVALDDRDMLHTLEGINSCVDRIETWKEALIGIWRWTGK
jgi:cell wall-associated NlpC family hydrolase